MNYYFKLTHRINGKQIVVKQWSSKSQKAAQTQIEYGYGETFTVKSCTEAEYRKIKNLAIA